MTTDILRLREALRIVDGTVRQDGYISINASVDGPALRDVLAAAREYHGVLATNHQTPAVQAPGTKGRIEQVPSRPFDRPEWAEPVDTRTIQELIDAGEYPTDDYDHAIVPMRGGGHATIITTNFEFEDTANGHQPILGYMGDVGDKVIEAWSDDGRYMAEESEADLMPPDYVAPGEEASPSPARDVPEWVWVYSLDDQAGKIDGIATALLTSFMWRETPEGYDYWREVWTKLEDMAATMRALQASE